MSQLSDRIDRAEAMVPSFTIVNDDPFVLQMESDSGDTEHTVVPNIAFCSCPDRQYRQLPCKHLLALAINRGVLSDVRDSVVSGIESTHVDITDEIEELEERLATLRGRESVWAEASEVGTDEQPGAGDPGDPFEWGSDLETVEHNADEYADDLIDRVAGTSSR